MKTKKLTSAILAATFCLASIMPATGYAATNTIDTDIGSLYSESKDNTGDIDVNGSIDAADASRILVEYSAISTGKTSTLTEAEQKRADVDKSGSIDSVDASYVLIYYAYVSTGGTASITEFLKDSQQPAATTATSTTATTVPTTTLTTTTSPPPITNTYITNGFTNPDTGEWYPSNGTTSDGKFSVPDIVPPGEIGYFDDGNGTWSATNRLYHDTLHLYEWGYDGNMFYIYVDPWWLVG